MNLILCLNVEVADMKRFSSKEIELYLFFVGDFFGGILLVRLSPRR